MWCPQSVVEVVSQLIIYPWLSKDFANQVRWSEDYVADCARNGVLPGKYVSPVAGEYLSGLVTVTCNVCLCYYSSSNS